MPALGFGVVAVVVAMPKRYEMTARSQHRNEIFLRFSEKSFFNDSQNFVDKVRPSPISGKM
jgi:hypothetical protein